MRVFLTGATGFLGGRIARQVVAGGDEVVALVRPSSDTVGLEAIGVELAVGDVRDPASLVGPLEGVDIAIHAAAWYELGIADVATMEAINVQGTSNVLTAAAEAGVPSIVHVSSTAALGPNPDGVGDESQPYDGRPRSAYERTKRLGHEVALRLAEEGAPVRLALPSTFYGPGDHSMVAVFLKAYLRGVVVIRTLSGMTLTLTHVDDVADGVLRIASRGADGESYILGADVVTLGEWLALLDRLTERPRHARVRVPIPDPFLRLASPGLSLGARLAGLPPRIVEEGLSMSVGCGWAFTSEKARREMGWDPRPLEEGMAETLMSLRPDPGHAPTCPRRRGILGMFQRSPH